TKQRFNATQLRRLAELCGMSDLASGGELLSLLGFCLKEPLFRFSWRKGFLLAENGNEIFVWTKSLSLNEILA
ncbi:MAG: hypothetical protein AAB545_03350, partial [Patescibacteria group bacterium]